MEMNPHTGKFRPREHGVYPLFPNRWSGRAMNGEPITREALFTLFEAARWAPSSFNNQPWRFFYALRDTEAWPRFLSLLTPNNRSWCENAGALLVIASKTTFDHNGKPMPSHSFDTGAAWMNLSLQGHISGLVVHGMGGFDHARARADLGLPEELAVEAMCAVGHPAPVESLPENLRAREIPSGRKPVEEFVFAGGFIS